MLRKRIVIGLIISALILIGGAGAWGGYLYSSVSKAAKKMYEPLPVIGEAQTGEWAGTGGGNQGIANAPDTQSGTLLSNSKQTKEEDAGTATASELERLRHPDLGSKDPFFMLLLGVDEREGDRGRSDSLVLIGVNPQEGTTEVLSIPRDTRLKLPKLEREEKINHAYAYGGTELAVSAVERLLGVPIAYYVKTNMEGFAEIITTLGGIGVDNTELAFTNLGYHFPLGPLELDGQQALAYTRMRFEDPNGDFGRMARQRQVLHAIASKMTDVSQAGKLPTLMTKLSSYVRTNFKLEDMFKVGAGYRSAADQVQTLELKGKSAIIDRLYYWQVSQEERIRVRQALLDGLKNEG